jgi:hypothetical protein
MSLANITSRRLRVLIGPDEQDWSLAVAGFGVGRNALDESGLLPIRGQLEILPVLSAPESIDPAENPARWHPGQPVRVQVPNQAGAWVDHPQGRLFILEEPDLPEEQGGILLQLGGRLAWHDSFEFDDDQTGVTIGTATNSATVAQNLLEANEILTADISLGTWPYSLTLPEGKGPAGSFVQQAGELAYSNDWRYLWQQPSGVVTATALDLSIAAPLVTITLGTNDLLYRRVKVEGTPPDRLKVAAVGVTVTSGENPSIEVSEVEGDRTQFSEGGVTCVGTGVIARATTTVWWDGDDVDGWHHYTQVVEEAPRSAVAYAPGNSGGLPCDLIAWKETLTDRHYNPNRSLIDVTTTEKQRGFTLCKTLAYRGFLNWYTLRETTETPYPSAKEVLERIVVTERVALVTLDPAASGAIGTATDPAKLIDASQKTTKWTQLSNTTWRKSESALIPKALTNSAPDANPAASIGNTSSSTSSSGQNQPPKVEFWDSGFVEEEIEYQYTLTYTPPAATGRTRKALKVLPYGFSEAQCQTMAVHHIRLAAGRHRAALIEFPISDALLSAPPLFPCNVVFPSGEVRHYRINGLAWEHTGDQAKAVGTGILVGTTPAPTEEEPSPSPVPLYTP